MTTKTADGELLMGLTKSFMFHGLLVVASLIAGIVIKETSSDKVNSKVEIIKSSVKVDVVGMPKYTLQELKKMTMDDFSKEPIPEVDKSEESGGDEKTAFEKVDKKAKINVNNLLANISSKKLKTKKRKKKNPINIDTRTLRNLVKSGNKISQGNALVGTSGEEFDATALDLYANNLPNIVKKFWKLPSYLANQELQCRVQLFISSTGQLLKTKIYESSGNEEYDQRAIKAIKSAAPFPAPESSFSKSVERGQILLGFPL